MPENNRYVKRATELGFMEIAVFAFVQHHRSCFGVFTVTIYMYILDAGWGVEAPHPLDYLDATAHLFGHRARNLGAKAQRISEQKSRSLELKPRRSELRSRRLELKPFELKPRRSELKPRPLELV